MLSQESEREKNNCFVKLSAVNQLLVLISSDSDNSNCTIQLDFLLIDLSRQISFPEPQSKNTVLSFHLHVIH